jgi:uncharacterized membrane protein YjjP (DUF1212 family)
LLYDNKNDYDFTMECDEIIALEVGARSGENDKGYPGVRETCLFLSEYAVQLFGSGCTCIRLEKNMKRIAASLGMNVEFSVLPRHIHITVSKGDSDFTSVIGIRDLPISFSRITDLSRLSWQMADGKIDFLTARSVLPRICNCACVNPWLLLLLVSLANASFCRLFSGDPMAMATVFIATFIGFLVKQILVRRHMDIRLTVLFCSFLSAMIAAAGSLLGIGGTPEIAVATSVLYLVPGIPFINSFCDLLDRHYLCAFGRAMNAVMLLCCLSLGLCAGMAVMHMAMF